MNRAASRNSLSLAMIEALHLAVVDLGKDAAVAAVALAADGPVFCAGHDLKERMPIVPIPTAAARSSPTP